MSKTVTLALAAAVGLVGSACTADRIQITHLKQGLMRPVDAGWDLYREGSRFDVVENGQCVVDSRQTPCMWFGIAFDYKAPSPKTTLKCTWTSGEPMISVTPTQVLERDVTEERVDYVLGARSGHEVRPGFIEVPWRGRESRLKYECSYQGTVVLSVEFALEGSA